MSILMVQLGSPRQAREGLRLGTVRRPPRGVPKAEYAKRDYFDVWLPQLSPSHELVQEGKSAQDEKSWSAFERKFRAEMKASNATTLLDLLAALSQSANFSLGCYCKD
jgi:uncharacterized protein YeaO (DUF488 family)